MLTSLKSRFIPRSVFQRALPTLVASTVALQSVLAVAQTPVRAAVSLQQGVDCDAVDYDGLDDAIARGNMAKEQGEKQEALKQWLAGFNSGDKSECTREFRYVLAMKIADEYEAIALAQDTGAELLAGADLLRDFLAEPMWQWVDDTSEPWFWELTKKEELLRKRYAQLSPGEQDRAQRKHAKENPTAGTDDAYIKKAIEEDEELFKKQKRSGVFLVLSPILIIAGIGFAVAGGRDRRDSKAMKFGGVGSLITGAVFLPVGLSMRSKVRRTARIRNQELSLARDLVQPEWKPVLPSYAPSQNLDVQLGYSWKF